MIKEKLGTKRLGCYRSKYKAPLPRPLFLLAKSYGRDTKPQALEPGLMNNRATLAHDFHFTYRKVSHSTDSYGSLDLKTTP